MNDAFHRSGRSRTNERGEALLLFVLLATVASSFIALSLGRGVYTDAVAASRARDTKQNILTADSGIEDAVYRLRTQKRLSDTETLALFQATTTTTIATVSGGTEVYASATSTALRTRKRKALLAPGSVGGSSGGASLAYGIQAGVGGIILSNAALVEGSVYTNGPLIGSNFMRIDGDAVSAGPTGRIAGAEVTGDARAHTIEHSLIGEDAYYQSITNTSVGGASHPGSADKPLISPAITDEAIAAQKSAAAAGGTLECSTYSIASQTVTLGPQRINCDLSISGASIITLAGPVWVAGSITISGSSVIRLSSSLAGASGAMIADNETNRLSDSRISLSNNSQFVGGTSVGAYVVLISQNNSSENGGSVNAISVSNDASGDMVLYAPHGEISLSNDAEVVSAAGYKTRGSNNVRVLYESNFTSVSFGSSSGPGSGGGYGIVSWEDVE